MMMFFKPDKHQVKLNIVEIEVLKKFQNNALSDEYIFSPINLNSIINLAEKDSSFAVYCKNKKFDKHWEQMWCITAELFIQSEMGNVIDLNFYPLNKISPFDLVRGIHCCYQGYLEARKINKNLSYTELMFLEKGIFHGSVHAVQRYNQYWYKKISESDDEDYIENIYNTVILENCHKITETYGSYAYLMLAEGFANYAKWLNSIQKFEQAYSALNSALEYCDLAKNVIKQSKNAIYHASFGEGLKSSNSLDMSDPKEFKKAIIKDFKLSISIEMINRN
jgi:hypothetical protein